MKLSQLISLSTVYVAAEAAIHQGGRHPRSGGVTCPPNWIQDPDDSNKCLPDATTSSFSVSCGATSMALEFAYNHLYENIESFIGLGGNGGGNSEMLALGETVIGGYGDNLACTFNHTGNFQGGRFQLAIDYSSQFEALTRRLSNNVQILTTNCAHYAHLRLIFENEVT